MKKARLPLRFLGAILLIAVLLADGCKKDTEPLPSVEGRWTITGYKVDPPTDVLGNGQKITDLLIYYRAFLDEKAVNCLTKLTVIFTQNGKTTVLPGDSCTIFNSPIRDGSNWKLDGSKLTISDSKGSTTYEVVYTVDTLKMAKTVKDDFDGDGKEEPVRFILELTRF